MRPMNVVAATGILGAVTAGLAGTAAADSTFTVNPDPAYRGQYVTVNVHPSCQEYEGTVQSSVFEGHTVNFTKYQGTVKATIKHDAELRKHNVYMNCGHHYYTSSVTVAPKGGAKTGIGGATDGTNTLLMGTGTALVLAAGGAMMLRRRQADAQR